jgi:integrase
MPWRSDHHPAYRLHRASGQAVVTLNGRDHYLGPYGGEQSRREYDRLIAEWLLQGRQSPTQRSDSPLTVTELIAAFWTHAKTYYRRSDGKPTTALKNFKDALKPLRRTYGHTAAAEFGPLAFKAVREEMIRMKWSRTYINKQVGRIKRIFKWAVENELVPPGVFHGLQAVASLKAGRSEARETEPVKPVPHEHVQAILPLPSRQVAAMVQLQLLSGMRPGEVTAIRPLDLEMGDDVWVWTRWIRATSAPRWTSTTPTPSRSCALIR